MSEEATVCDVLVAHEEDVRVCMVVDGETADPPETDVLTDEIRRAVENLGCDVRGIAQQTVEETEAPTPR